MYDWANSVYATNIMAAIYPTIFASTIPGGDIRWGYGTSIATFIVAILAPFLGAVADYKGMKKKLFTLFALLGIVFTPLMAALGSWKLCLVGYVVSRIGFSGSCLFYDSFLTDVTTDERMDHVSSWGYAMGYIGGSTIPFVISIAILLLFDYNRFSQVFSVLIVSAWWAVFSIPFFRNVKQEHYVEKTEPVSPARIFRNVIGTRSSVFRHRVLLLYRRREHRHLHFHRLRLDARSRLHRHDSGAARYADCGRALLDLVREALRAVLHAKGADGRCDDVRDHLSGRFLHGLLDGTQPEGL